MGLSAPSPRGSTASLLAVGVVLLVSLLVPRKESRRGELAPAAAMAQAAQARTADDALLAADAGR